jgi:hypothetical protein
MTEAITCLRWVEILISFAVILQTIELFSIRKAFSEQGIWRWSILRNEFPCPGLFDLFLNDRSFLVVLTVRLLAALFLIVKAHWLFSFVLALTTLLIALRWLGTFNGGSDYMTFLILYSVSIGRFFETDRRILKGALLYLAIQTCLSYFVAGIVKLKRADWRSGKTLRDFLISSNYQVPEFVKDLTSRSKYFLPLAAWILIVFECCFPLALRGFSIFFFGAAIIFHLGAFYLFGLNRFVFAWIASYPTIFFIAQSGLHS